MHLCALHQRIDNALALVEAAFSSTTLTEILTEPTCSYPLCEPPSANSLLVVPTGPADPVPNPAQP
jgi:hypothetical protein